MDTFGSAVDPLVHDALKIVHLLTKGFDFLMALVRPFVKYEFWRPSGYGWYVDYGMSQHHIHK